MKMSARPATYRRSVAVVLAPYLLCCAVFLTVLLVLRDRLPDPVATHFTGGGRADGHTSLGALPYVALGLLVVPGAVLTACAVALNGGRAGGKPGVRPVTALAYGVAGLLAVLLTGLLVVNARAASAEDARLPLGALFAALAVAVAAAGVGALVAGREKPTA
ncbi:hypothetical protein J7E86_09290, partial [Streptomyces sp. ISL-11]|nr:hypothetical protein [Streptomyces sp. ISL-11]